jgi:hypothetical protein
MGAPPESRYAVHGHGEQPCETAAAPKPEFRSEGHGPDWHGELDSALDVIDSRLARGRRAAPDGEGLPPAVRAEFRDVKFTPEILDELASRVAQRLLADTDSRRPQAPAAPPPTFVNEVREPAGSTARPVVRTPAYAAISIRIRRPLFTWPFARRRHRRQPHTASRTL